MPTESENRYLAQLRARALEIERSRRASESEGSTEWTPADQHAFDRQWDGMTLAQALRATGGNHERLTDNRFNEMALADDDPMIAQFREQFGERAFVDENGRPIEAPDSGNAAAAGYTMGYGEPTYGGYEGRDILQDGGRVMRLPDGRYIREAGNLNTGEIVGAQRADETTRRQMRQRGAASMAAVLGGGLAYGAMAGGAGAGAAGAGAGSAGSAFPMVEIPGALSAAGIPAEAGALAAAPAISGGAGAAGGGGGFLSQLGSTLSGSGSLGDLASAAGSGLADYVTSNPVGALQTVGGLASMGAGLAGGRSSGGSATGDLDGLLERQANANRYDWNTPTGSRSWQQGADGRWTVNDRLNPEEQANYENVRTLNSDSTGFARDLLARTMAAPRRDYFADLPSTDSYYSRWRG